jgi:hypothetical protein
MRNPAILSFALLGGTACGGTTGSDLFTFSAAAAGPEGADPSRPFTFTSGRGYDVTLTTARLHIGALYLNRVRATPGAQATACVLPGTYVAQITRGLDVDLLSAAPQPFPEVGEALSERAYTAEVWLTGGDVNEADTGVAIFTVTGTAAKNAAAYPFDGAVTIGRNRAVRSSDPAQPGANPICKQRIVSPIAVDITPRRDGRLVVRADPRAFLTDVDFAALGEPSGVPPRYRFEDASARAPDRALYERLRATRGSYTFSWEE